ncbi:MAG TPA: 2-phosphosulfolactate phosphatase [Gaiellaceae bacterium]|nr:2-phosphosulfolactate phosphatase [Gaiellaceae bacterium]
MRVHVAFTPGEAARVPTGIVVDVLRATSTIAQALETAVEAVYCCAEVEEARSLRDELGDAVLAGERRGGNIPGFNFGNSPREFLEPRGEALVLTTTNGTRAIVAAAAACDAVLAGSLLNLAAVAAAARERGEDVEIVCAGVQGHRSEDDAYCAGRIVELLGGEHTPAAEEAVRLAGSFANAEEAFRAARLVGETISEEDLLWCARESTTAAVPRFAGMRGPAARLVSRP